MSGKSLIIVLFLFSNFVINIGISGQDLAGEELRTLFSTADTSRHDYTQALKESTNEIDVTVSVLFLFYKTFLSSQDVPTCIFTPSCSEYALQSFQQKGIFIGWLNTFDRLSRCHGLVNPAHYHFDVSKNRFYDPVL